MCVMVPSDDEVGSPDGIFNASVPPICASLLAPTTSCKAGRWTCVKAKEGMLGVEVKVLEPGGIRSFMHRANRLKSGLKKATVSLQCGKFDFVAQPIANAVEAVAKALLAQTHPSGFGQYPRHEHIGEALTVGWNLSSTSDTLLQTAGCEQSRISCRGRLVRSAVWHEPPDAYDGRLKFRSKLRHESRKQGARKFIVSLKASNSQSWTFAVTLNDWLQSAISARFVVLRDWLLSAPIAPEEYVTVIPCYHVHAFELSFASFEHVARACTSKGRQATTAVRLDNARKAVQWLGSARAPKELATAATMSMLARVKETSTRTREDRLLAERHVQNTKVAHDVVPEGPAPYSVMPSSTHGIGASIVMPRDGFKPLNDKRLETVIGLWLAGDPLRPALRECLCAVHTCMPSSNVYMHAIVALCEDAMRRPNYWRHQVIVALPLPRAESYRDFGAQHVVQSLECLRRFAPHDVGDLLLRAGLETSQGAQVRQMLPKTPSEESFSRSRELQDRILPGLDASRSECAPSLKNLEKPCRKRRVSHALVQFARQQFSKEQHSRGRDYAAPKSPSPPDLVAETLSQLHTTGKLQSNTIVADLGCGDGRWLVGACSRYGCTGVGFDIDHDMLDKAKANVNAAGLTHRVQLRHGDLFAQSLANFDMIVAYLFRAGCARLQSKLEFELKPSAVLVCVGFALPRWKPYWEHRTSAGLFVRLYMRSSQHTQ